MNHDWTAKVHKRVRDDIREYKIPHDVINAILDMLEHIASLDNPRNHYGMCPVVSMRGKSPDPLWRFKSRRAYEWRGFVVIVERSHTVQLVAIRPRTPDTYDENRLIEILNEIASTRK